MKGLKSILDIVYPRTCPICGKTLSDDKLICDVCNGRLVYANKNICIHCGKILKDRASTICKVCETSETYFEEGRSVFYYNDAIKNALMDFKYHNRRENAKFFAESIMQSYADRISLWNIDLIVPIPVHKKKLIERGYNQAAVLASELCKLSKWDWTEALIRVEKTKPQKELTRLDRLNNLEKAIMVDDKKLNLIKDKNILIIDDIYTTGATVSSSSKVLLESGASKVFFITVATGMGN
ncbi:ComF family protein [uncultured Eubacterium sp.]|uniref:ComF family protein n=1 Tax=uncultured Eubacterium sp. TaxID=165185 RepID=UPI000ED12577|nr:ComF family protein [uncultured Eubacterium sp.]HAH18618.1 hypothetical protein [Eubacterium sp.]